MSMITWNEFGTYLREARILQHLSQTQLAERIGCHRTYIWKLEQGKNIPSEKFFHILAYECPALRSDLTLYATFESMAAYRLEDNASLQPLKVYTTHSTSAP